MARDVKDAGDAIGAALGTIAREIGGSVSSNGHKGAFRRGSDGLTGARGVAAGAALAAAAPIAGRAVKKLAAKGGGVKEAVGEKAEQVGDAPGIAKAVGKKMLPGGGGNKGNESASGVGKGRRMPVQQATDIAVPLAVAYNQWTQFEEWPQFMHRLDQVTQEDDCTVSFKTKLWGMSKEFVAQIDEQRPDERIQWSVTQGVTHNGVVTFHELAPRLTRVQVSLDVEPGSLVEKAARGMRHVKRAVRADLARFKAFVEIQEEETGAWRGTIRDGKVVKKQEQKKSASRGSSGRSRSKAKSQKRSRSRSGSTRKRGASRS
jgi:uncharacterized membrane protein